MEGFEKINKYCLFLLVFTVTFEYWDPVGLVGVVTITYMASALYIVSWVPLFRINLNFNLFRRYLWPLGLYIIMGIFSTALNSNYAGGVVDAYNGRVVLLILLMLLVANHLANDTTLVSKVLNIYAFSIVLMYILVLLSVGIEYRNGRLMMFGENPNVVGMKAAIAFAIVLSNLISSQFKILKLLYASVAIYAFLNLIMLSGSRGGLISVFLVLAISVFFTKIGIVKKFLFTISGILFSIFFYNFILSTQVDFSTRILRTVETGDTGRKELWLGAIDTIEDNMFLGVGIPGALPEMYKRTGHFNDAHNVFLDVLMTTGIMGFIFYFLFIYRLGKSLSRHFAQNGRIVFLVIFILLLFNMSKSGGGISKILYWFFFAILIGSTFSAKKTVLIQGVNK